MVPSWLIELSLGGSWVDVSDRLMGSISINRGRPNELASISAGQASFVLDNSDGAFTPDWSGSPYYPDVQMFTPVRISAHDGTGWVRTSRVGDQLIKRYPDFDVRNFGSKSLNKFLASLPELEVEERILANGNPIQFVHMRPAPAPKKPARKTQTKRRTTRKSK